AQVQLRDAAALTEQARREPHFLSKVREVAIRPLVVSGDHHIAAAEGTHPTAEWDVDVNRQRLAGCFSGLNEAGRVVGGTVSGRPFRSCWIAGVTRTGLLIASNRVRGDFWKSDQLASHGSANLRSFPERRQADSKQERSQPRSAGISIARAPFACRPAPFAKTAPIFSGRKSLFFLHHSHQI